MHDANGLLIAFASFPAATCLSSASVAIRSGMLPRWLDAMSFDRDRMVNVPNRGKLAGSWPSTPASAPPDGMQRLLNHARWDADQVRDTCAATWWSHLATLGGAGGRRDRIPQERERPRWACNATTRPRLARSTTPSWGCSWPMPAEWGGRSSTGSCTAPQLDRGSCSLPGRRVPEESGSRPSRSWPESCWSARPGRRGAGQLGDRR